MDKLRIELFLILCLSLLTGCVPSHLTVQTQYLSHENLASYHVMTPDPDLDHPNLGQRILVQWMLPKEYLKYDSLILKMRLRFRNRKEETIELSIKKLKGVYLYGLLNETYCATGGIATYKVEVLGDGCCLEIWKHPLWNELILINPTNCPL